MARHNIIAGARCVLSPDTNVTEHPFERSQGSLWNRMTMTMTMTMPESARCFAS
jgi:hypothetical protein